MTLRIHKHNNKITYFTKLNRSIEAYNHIYNDKKWNQKNMNEKKGKTQEKMERGSRKRSSSAGSEKMERVGGR